MILRIENIQCDHRAHAAVHIHRSDVPPGEPHSLVADIDVPAGEVVRLDLRPGTVITIGEKFRG